MSRPLYESPLDLKKEEAAIKVVASRNGCSYEKLPLDYRADYLLLKENRPSAVAEVKCRANPREQYPTLMLSLNKWRHSEELSRYLGVPFVLIASWTDGVFVHKAGSAEISFGFGGRIDRNDSQDREPVVFIPTTAFTFVGYSSGVAQQ